MVTLRHLAPATILLLGGCFSTVDIGEEAQIRCAADTDCPSPMTCQTDANRCALPGISFDTTPPILISATSSVAAIGAAGSAIITITTSETLASARVRLEGEDDPLDVTIDGSAISVAVDATVAGVSRPAGPVTLVVVAVDVAGNESAEGRLAPGLTIDPDAPDIRGDEVLVQAGPDNVLFPGRTDAARADSVVEIEIDWTEATAARRGLQFEDDSGTVVTVDVDLGVGDPSRTVVLLGAAELANLPDGTWTVSVEVEDAVGNVARRELVTPLRVDTTPPPSPTFTLLTRAPFGSTAANPSTSATGLADDALLVLGVTADVVVDPAADPARAPPSVARAVVDGGAFAFSVGIDVPGLQVVAVDAAGNLSAAVSAARAGLVASTLLASTPHEVRARRLVAEQLVQRGDARVDDVLRDTGAVTTTSGVAWHPLTTRRQDPFPGPAVLARDLVGGGLLAMADGFTFRVRDFQVVRLDVPRLPVRRGAQMVTDPERGRIVLFGGTDSSGATRNDLFEWDGSSWRTVLANDPTDVTRPGPREGHGMTYLPGTGSVAVVGGCGGEDQNFSGCRFPIALDAWSWDGRAFTTLCSGGCGVSSQQLLDTTHPAVTADVDGTPLLIGTGLVSLDGPRLFRLDNGAFTASCTGPTCAGLIPGDGVVAFDPARNLPVLFGTCSSAPCAVHIDGDVVEQTPLSAALPFIGSSGSFQPDGVAVDERGTVVVANGSNPGALFGVKGGDVATIVPRTVQPRCGGAAAIVDGEVRVLGGCTACEVDTAQGWCTDPLSTSEAPEATVIPRPATPVTGSAFAVPLNDDTVVVQRVFGAADAGSMILRRASDLAVSVTIDVGAHVYATGGYSTGGTGSADLIMLRGASDLSQFPPAFGALEPNLRIDADNVVTDACTGTCGATHFSDGRGEMIARTRGGRGLVFGGTGNGIANIGVTEATTVYEPDGQGTTTAALSPHPLARAFGNLVYDPERDLTWLFGGTVFNARNEFGDVGTCGIVGGPQACGDLWRFDGTAWEQVDPVDVTGFGPPPARLQAQAAWSDGNLVVSGGATGAAFFPVTATDDAWRLEASSATPMSHQLVARYATYGDDALQAFDGVSLRWCGTAVDATGSAVPVTLRVWAGGRFHDATTTVDGGCVDGTLATAGVQDLVVDETGQVVAEVLPVLGATGGADPSLTTTTFTVTTFFAPE